MKSYLAVQEKVFDVAEVSKRSSLVAYNRLLDVITNHSNFVGPDGKGATSKAGLSIQINRKIKEVFGRSVDELKSDYDTDTLMAIRIKVARVIQASEAVPLNRSRIKKLIYQAIEDVYKLMN